MSFGRIQFRIRTIALVTLWVALIVNGVSTYSPEMFALSIAGYIAAFVTGLVGFFVFFDLIQHRRKILIRLFNWKLLCWSGLLGIGGLVSISVANSLISIGESFSAILVLLSLLFGAIAGWRWHSISNNSKIRKTAISTPPQNPTENL